jgi:T-complex protein 1 subunit beta
LETIFPLCFVSSLRNGEFTLLYLRALLTLLQSYNNPTQIFAEDVTEEKGENARLSAFVGAIAVGDLVKSTLGPKGMDKILQSA